MTTDLFENRFLRIAITSPASLDNEAGRITEILQSKQADIVHIRKPEWNVYKTETLIKAIPEIYHRQLKLHDHYELLKEFNLMGVHLNGRNLTAPKNADSVSISYHSIEQLVDSEHYDYVTLSPIFDSISKKRYLSAFNLDKLPRYLQGRKVIALGGVTPEKIPLLVAIGFSGCAMLGYFWNE